MKTKITAILLTTAALILAGLALLSSGETAVKAQTDTDTTERVIQVMGQGSVSARPDTAVVRLGVETDADTAAAALDDNNVRMSALISVTLEAGIAEEDMQTQGLRLQAIYQDQTDTDTLRQVVGYRASNIVAVTVRDLDGLGAFLDEAIAAGGNTIQSINFEVSDRDELIAAAREAAMNDAIAKAEQLTGLAGADLGEVLTITEFGGSSPAPVAFESAQAAADSVPIAAGTQEIQTTIQVSWRIVSGQ